MDIELDAVDLQILELMQGNARISNVDLAKQLSMAPSAVLERVKKLEQKKVILQYNTAVNPQAVNQKLPSFLSGLKKPLIQMPRSRLHWLRSRKCRKCILWRGKIAFSLKSVQKIPPP